MRLGETLETISRRYGVPVAAIMEANSITSPATVRPGQHLVIPHRRGPGIALCRAPQTRIASAAPTVPSAAPVGPPRTALAPTAAVHVVAPGETLHSIARLYGKPVLVLAKANNIPPDTLVKIGERIVIPEAGAGPRPVSASTAAALAGCATRRSHGGSLPSQNLATADSPHSARLASPAPG